MKKVAKKAARSTHQPRRPSVDAVRTEYDFTTAVRGKYAKRVAEGTNLILLDPDVATQFRTARAVNRALRDYLKSRPR